jgi:O-antigen ligase
VLLAVYTVIALAKLHELFPASDKVQPAKIVGALLIVSACFVLRPRAILAALLSPPALCVMVITVLALLSVPGAVWSRYSLEFLVTVYWKTLVFFAIVATAWCDRATVRQAILALVLGFGLVAIALLTGVAQAVMGRVYVGTSLDPNETALQLLVVIPLALYVASFGRLWKVIGLGIALLLVAGIAQTGSRGGLVGLIALGVWLLVQVRPRRRLMSVLVVAGGAAVIALTASDVTRQRFATMLRPSEDYNFTARVGRLQLWKRGLGHMARNPLLGVGVQGFAIAEGESTANLNDGDIAKYQAAHNPFIQIGAELGVFGLVAFVWMLWSAWAGCRRVRAIAHTLSGASGSSRRALAESEAHLANAALGALIALVAAGFFLSVAYDAITYFVVAACIAVRLGSPLGRAEVVVRP